MLFIASVLALAGWIWIIVKIRRREIAHRKMIFERTNSAGVVEWESFEDMRADEKSQTRQLLFTILMFFPGALIPLASIVMIFGSILMWFD